MTAVSRVEVRVPECGNDRGTLTTSRYRRFRRRGAGTRGGVGWWQGGVLRRWWHRLG
jgi:hypothetical protein